MTREKKRSSADHQGDAWMLKKRDKQLYESPALALYRQNNKAMGPTTAMDGAKDT